MQREDVEHVNQMISTLEESVEKLDIYYEKKDNVNFDKTKKLIINLLSKISEMVK